LFIEIDGVKKLFSIDCSLKPELENQAYKFTSKEIKAVKQNLLKLYLTHNDDVLNQSKISKSILPKKEKVVFTKDISNMIHNTFIKTVEKPYCYIGLVKKRGISTTGIMIEKNIVLTSAKILFDKVNNAETSAAEISFSLNRSDSVVRSPVKDFYYHPSFKLESNGEALNDWALIYLHNSLGDQIFEVNKQQKYYKLIVTS
jgi:hypothetical protein